MVFDRSPRLGVGAMEARAVALHEQVGPHGQAQSSSLAPETRNTAARAIQ